MKTDLEIAQQAKIIPVIDIARALRIPEELIIPCGRYKAKISLKVFDQLKDKSEGRLILVTAMTPTPRGEGKTTVSIGLSMALNRIGKSSIVALREPSLGPVFGIKGGAAGGGYAQVLPMEDINLHFTGDIHAVSSAHNLLSAVLDNHIHFGNKLNVDEREIIFTRVMDMNDRSLRNIVVGLGGKKNGPAREDGFMITAASEVMAILSLSESIDELKERLDKIFVSYDMNGKPIFTRDFGVTGAMAILLKDAIKPNLVQTIEHTPAFIHCGPFANIAHGTCSIVSIKLSQRLCDYTVVEAGFGSDLGAEKFIDIVCRKARLGVDVGVLVATIRALKWHGGILKDKSGDPLSYIKKGLENLEKHIENMKKFNIPMVIALNIFEDDTEAEIRFTQNYFSNKNIPMAVVEVFEKGSAGAIDLAKYVVESAEKRGSVTMPIYELNDSVEKKIEKVALEIYGAERVVYTPRAEKNIKRINKLGLDKLPICIAKTFLSLSDDPKLLGRPRNFKITIRGVMISSGAGFLVPLTREVMLMPGLPRRPNAANIGFDNTGKITGLF